MRGLDTVSGLFSRTFRTQLSLILTRTMWIPLDPGLFPFLSTPRLLLFPFQTRDLPSHLLLLLLSLPAVRSSRYTAANSWHSSLPRALPVTQADFTPKTLPFPYCSFWQVRIVFIYIFHSGMCLYSYLKSKSLCKVATRTCRAVQIFSSHNDISE